MGEQYLYNTEKLEKLSKEDLIHLVLNLQSNLKQEEKAKEAFIESSYDGYWDWKLAEDYEYMSPRFWEIFGIDHRTRTHHPNEWQDLIFQEDLELALENLRLHVETKGHHPYRQEVRYRHADGSTVTVLCRGQVVEWDEDGNAVRMIGTHTDITRLKKVQNELINESKAKSELLTKLEKSEKRTHSILYDSINGILTINGEGIIQSFNPAAEEIFGYPASEIIGKNVNSLIPEPHRTRHDAYLGNFHRTGESNIIGNIREVEASKSDGTLFPVQLSVSEVEAEEGKLFSAMILDITEQKKILTELETAKLKATQADLMKSEFLTNVSHELRSPLNSLMLLIHVLLKNPDKNLTEKQVENLEVIRKSGQDLTFLINDLLDHSMIVKGQIEIKIEEVEVASIAQNLHSAFVSQFKEKGIEFSVVNKCSPNATITTDSIRVEQMLRNLIMNAFKFTYEGEVQVLFNFSDDGENSSLEISVTDTGVGIANSEIGQIFGHFTQGAEGKKKKYQGVGLGLSIVSRIAELLECRITVSSELNNGSRFTLTVPRHISSSVEADRNLLSEADMVNQTVTLPDNKLPLLKNRKMLVVDDDLRTIYAVRELLFDSGLILIPATGGFEALELAEKHKDIDIVLTDIMMPEMDGIEMVSRLVKLEHMKDVPFIAMSGHIDDQQTQITNRHFSSLLRKPVDVRLLLSTIITLFEAE